MHGGEQQNVRLADDSADNVRLLIEKLHVDDGIERKVQAVGKMPGAIDAHHWDRFRQQGKIDIAGRRAGGGQQDFTLHAVFQRAQADQRHRFPFIAQRAYFAARRAGDAGKRPQIFIVTISARAGVAIDLLKQRSHQSSP